MSAAAALQMPEALPTSGLDALLEQLADVWVSGPDGDGFVWIHGERLQPAGLHSSLNLTIISAELTQAALARRAADPDGRSGRPASRVVPVGG